MNDSPLGDVTRDKFLGGALELVQPKAGYRAGSDPLFMAAMVKIPPNGRFLDVGCGVGTASLALLTRIDGITGVGLDVQTELLRLGGHNALLNQLDQRLELVEGCVLSPPKSVPRHAFDVVMSNPPWYEKGRISTLPSGSKAIGFEEEVPLQAWISRMVQFLRPKGRFYMIHRADRLADILACMSGEKLGEIRVMPLWPKPGREAARVIVTARKDFKTPFALLPGLLVHHENGQYTDLADRILKGQAVLDGEN